MKYTIHSNNAEIIDILLNQHIKPEDKTYLKCFEESIKCHHNEIANFIHGNLLPNENEEYFEISIKYHNYFYLPDVSKLSVYFYNFYINDYSTITKYLIEEKEISSNEHTIKNTIFRFTQMIQDAANKNDTIEIYFLLSTQNKIQGKITQSGSEIF